MVVRTSFCCLQISIRRLIGRPVDSSQDALWHYMVDYFDQRHTELVKEKLGTDILDAQLAYSIRFYCMGSVGMTQEWLLNDNITSAETVVEMMFHSMPENLRRILF